MGATRIELNPVSNGFGKLPSIIKSRCGLEVDAREVGFSGDDNGATANALAEFKLNGITSVIVATDPISPGTITQGAQAEQYFPEWVISGMSRLDDPELPGLFGYSTSEWQNAFGISPTEMRTRDEDTDWFRAYKEMDPAGTPEVGVGALVFPYFLQIANGIQMAGPHLTPETFRHGLITMPPRSPDPPQFMCCGFSSSNFSYSSMVNEIYFDSSGTAPNCAECRGTYIYPDCGKRYGPGQIPEAAPEYFKGGCRLPGDGRSAPPPPQRTNP